MHPFRTTLVTIASVAALGLAGCSSSGSTEPTPAPSETTSAAPTSEVGAELDIANPKNLASVKDGCQLLKPEQAQKLGATTPQPNDSPLGPSCKWEQGETRINFTASTDIGMNFSGDPDGQVDGYPFVKKTGTETACGLGFAAADKQTLIVTAFTGSDSPTQPCELAKQAAVMAISNLPPAK